MTATMKLRTRRVYDDPEDDDGVRILVDRLWPRGLSREKARLDEWMKDLAPSDGLRKWFGHRPERWEEFRAAYLEELEHHADTLAELGKLARRQTVTLLFAAKDRERNNAVVVRDYLTGRRPRTTGRRG